jgi:hypothetical protein
MCKTIILLFVGFDCTSHFANSLLSTFMYIIIRSWPLGGPDLVAGGHKLSMIRTTWAN